MSEAVEIDVDQLMERIRENTTKRWSKVSPINASAPLAESQMPADFACLQDGSDICHIDFTSHRKVVGRFIVFIKNLLRQLLTPILERQFAFNAATARAVTYLWEQVEAMRQQQAAAAQTLWAEIAKQMEVTRQHQDAILQTLQQEVEASRQQQAAALQGLRTKVLEHVQEWGRWGEHMEKKLSSLEQTSSTLYENITTLELAQKESATRLEKALSRLQTDHTLQERRLAMLLEEARKGLPEPLSQDQLQVFANEGQRVRDALYVSFEDQFRRTHEEIKERFRMYLPLLKQAMLGSESMSVLDVGCGRGEWLELLQEEGLRAQGVDLNRVLVEECRGRGLEVIEGEAMAYLASLRPNSLGAVTGLHLIEHLPFEGVIKLLDETVRVLKPGGVAIFETPNPEKVVVASCSSYVDLSHHHPLPRSMAKFLAEARGLCQVEIMDLHPYPESYRVEGGGLNVAQRFNEYFYGPHDYAIIGWKV
jgi:O-antigen chain-terminating methyltransferase